MSPSVSFIIPVRNDARRLRRCLETVRATAADVSSEIIVADNGSTDDSARVAAEAGAVVISLPDRPVADVRNQAAARARGEYLAFVDADHELDRGWSSAAMPALSDRSVDAVGAQYHGPPDGTWVQRAYDRLRRHRPGDHAVGWLPSGNLIIRRATFERLGGFDATLETCEDVDLCQRLTSGGGRIMALDGMRSVHLGDPATLGALFGGELWRGRDNLRVSLRVPLTLRSAPSVALPILTLLAMMAVVAGIVTGPFGGWPLAVAGAAWIILLALARAIALTWLGTPANHAITALLETWIVALVYDIARALALISRSGHSVRRR